MRLYFVQFFLLFRREHQPGGTGHHQDFFPVVIFKLQHISGKLIHLIMTDFTISFPLFMNSVADPFSFCCIGNGIQADHNKPLATHIITLVW